jgi:hypothetical protein
MVVHMTSSTDGKKKTNEKMTLAGPLAGRPRVVEDVDPDVLVVEQGVAGRQQVGHPEQVPLELLHEHPALLEPVPRDHVEEDDEDHGQQEPGREAAHALLDGVDLAGELAHHAHLADGGFQRARQLARPFWPVNA